MAFHKELILTKTLLSFCATLLLLSFSTNTNSKSNLERNALSSFDKFDSVISVLEYGESDPVRIAYRVYPYGGSGNYEYRWRVYGKAFGGKGSDRFELNFPCKAKGEKQICKIFCEVTDVDTGKKFTAEYRHPVIPCYTLKQ